MILAGADGNGVGSLNVICSGIAGLSALLGSGCGAGVGGAAGCRFSSGAGVGGVCCTVGCWGTRAGDGCGGEVDTAVTGGGAICLGSGGGCCVGGNSFCPSSPIKD